MNKAKSIFALRIRLLKFILQLCHCASIITIYICILFTVTIIVNISLTFWIQYQTAESAIVQYFGPARDFALFLDPINIKH